MKEINFLANILFLESAREKFNFPLNNSIRISFWLINSTSSTFCEIIFHNENVELNKSYKTQIHLLERDFLKGRLLKNCEFEVGNYPTVIGKGKIIEII